MCSKFWRLVSVDWDDVGFDKVGKEDNNVEEVEGVVDDLDVQGYGCFSIFITAIVFISENRSFYKTAWPPETCRFLQNSCDLCFFFPSYMLSAFACFITPRLPVLDKENTQLPSALLKLFHLWATDSNFVPFLVYYVLKTLPKLIDCLVATNDKPSVVSPSRVFDVVDALLQKQETVLKPRVLLLYFVICYFLSVMVKSTLL